MINDDVINRLATLGYIAADSDAALITFIVSKVTNQIINNCNINTLPDVLFDVAIDMAAGEFLYNKKASGQLTSMEIEYAVKSMQIGDTKVEYDTGTNTLNPEQQFDTLVYQLMSGSKEELLCYRKLSW